MNSIQGSSSVFFYLLTSGSHFATERISTSNYSHQIRLDKKQTWVKILNHKLYSKAIIIVLLLLHDFVAVK